MSAFTPPIPTIRGPAGIDVEPLELPPLPPTVGLGLEFERRGIEAPAHIAAITEEYRRRGLAPRDRSPAGSGIGPLSDYQGPPSFELDGAAQQRRAAARFQQVQESTAAHPEITARDREAHISQRMEQYLAGLERAYQQSAAYQPEGSFDPFDPTPDGLDFQTRSKLYQTLDKRTLDSQRRAFGQEYDQANSPEARFAQERERVGEQLLESFRQHHPEADDQAAYRFMQQELALQGYTPTTAGQMAPILPERTPEDRFQVSDIPYLGDAVAGAARAGVETIGGGLSLGAALTANALGALGFEDPDTQSIIDEMQWGALGVMEAFHRDTDGAIDMLRLSPNAQASVSRKIVGDLGQLAGDIALVWAGSPAQATSKMAAMMPGTSYFFVKEAGGFNRSVYDGLVAKGVDKRAASRTALMSGLAAGAISGILERVPMEQYLLPGRGSLIMGAIKGAISEGSTEAMQELTQVLIESGVGVNDSSYWENLGRIGYAAMLGSVAGGAFGMLPDSKRIEMLERAAEGDPIAHATLQVDRAVREAAQRDQASAESESVDPPDTDTTPPPDQAEDLPPQGTDEAQGGVKGTEGYKAPRIIATPTQMAAWYRKTFSDDSPSAVEAIKLLASQANERFIRTKVPVNMVSLGSVEEGIDLDQDKVNEIAAVSDQEVADMPPAILTHNPMAEDGGPVLYAADGNHRLAGFAQAGRTLIDAYVPESIAKQLEAGLVEGRPDTPRRVETDQPPPPDSAPDDAVVVEGEAQADQAAAEGPTGPEDQTRVGGVEQPARAPDVDTSLPIDEQLGQIDEQIAAQNAIIAGIEGRIQSGEITRAEGDAEFSQAQDRVRELTAQVPDFETQQRIRRAERAEQAFEREYDARRVDQLTGIGNRLASDEQIADLRERADRENKPVAVGGIDLVLFKQVNDVLGHQAGDEALAAAAQAMLRSIRTAGDRPADALHTVSRRGGDEFEFLLYDVTPQQAQMIGERMQEAYTQAIDKLGINEKLPGNMQTALGFGFEIRQPGDARSDVELRVAADEDLERRKSELKKALGVDKITRESAAQMAKATKAPDDEASEQGDDQGGGAVGSPMPDESPVWTQDRFKFLQARQKQQAGRETAVRQGLRYNPPRMEPRDISGALTDAGHTIVDRHAYPDEQIIVDEQGDMSIDKARDDAAGLRGDASLERIEYRTSGGETRYAYQMFYRDFNAPDTYTGSSFTSDRKFNTAKEVLDEAKSLEAAYRGKMGKAFDRDAALAEHRQSVEDALRRGEPVPLHVLSVDYPDLWRQLGYPTTGKNKIPAPPDDWYEGGAMQTVSGTTVSRPPPSPFPGGEPDAPGGPVGSPMTPAGLPADERPKPPGPGKVKRGQKTPSGAPDIGADPDFRPLKQRGGKAFRLRADTPKRLTQSIMRARARRDAQDWNNADNVYEIIADMGRRFGSGPPGVGRRRLLKKWAAGFFEPGRASIRLRRGSWVQTMAHELGHHLHQTLFPRRTKKAGAVISWKDLPGHWRSELLALGKELYGDKKPTGGYALEGWAEVVRYLIVSPQTLKAKAPVVYSEVVPSLVADHPEVWLSLMDARVRLINATIRAGGNPVSQYVRREGRSRYNLRNLIDWFRTLVFDRHQRLVTFERDLGLEDLPEHLSPYIASLRANGHISGDIKIATERGTFSPADPSRRVTGPSLVEILEPVAEGGQDSMDLWEDYMIARRTLEKREQGYDVLPPEAQQPTGPTTANLQDFIKRVEADHPMWGDYFRQRGGIQEIKDEETGEITEEGIEDPETVAAQFRRYNRWLIRDYAVHYGLISEEAAEAIIAANLEYITFRHAKTEDALQQTTVKGGVKKGGFVKTGSGIRRFREGLGEQLYPPIESFLASMQGIMSRARLNEVGRQVVSVVPREIPGAGRWVAKIDRPIDAWKVDPTTLSEEVKNQLGIEVNDGAIGALPPWLEALDERAQTDVIAALEGINGATFFKPGNRTDRDNREVTVLEGGRPRFYEVKDRMLFDLLEGLDNPQAAHVMVRMVGLPGRVLRAGATQYNPSFFVPNFMRDMMQALTMTESDLRKLDDQTRTRLSGMKQAFMGGQYEKLFLASGADMSGLFGEYYDARKQQLDLSRMFEKPRFGGLVKGENFRGWIRDMVRLGGIDRLNRSFELATRLGEFAVVYEQRREAGQGEAQAIAAAGQAAADITLDYQRGGTFAKAANEVIPFFNAALLGTDKLARFIQKNPVKALGRVFSMLIMPSLAQLLLNLDNEDYWSKPIEMRDRYWYFPTGTDDRGDQTYIRIAKPYGLGLFSIMAERSFGRLFGIDPTTGEPGGDEEAFQGFGAAVVRELRPSVNIAGLVPIMEVTSGPQGWSYFRDREIVSHADKDLPLGEQGATRSSELARVLGRWMDYPPAKIDYLIQGFGGGLARDAVQVGVDPVIRSVDSDAGKGEPMSVEDWLIVRRFLAGQTRSGHEAISRFYDAHDRLARITAGLRSRDGEPEKQAEYAKRYAAQIDLYPLYSSASRQMGQQFSAIRELYRQQDDMEADEFTKQVDALYDSIIETARDVHRAHEVTTKEQ